MAESKAPEMTDEQRILFEKGRHSSLVFLRKNPDYILNGRNALLMKEELQKRNLTWTSDNLQDIWDKVDRAIFDTEDERPAAKELPAPIEAPPPQPEQFPWGLALTIENDGKNRVAKMSGPELSKYMSDRHHGDEFKSQIAALKMTRSDLREN
jgi:hypothetical protein